MHTQVPPLAFRARPRAVEDLLGQEEAKALLRDFSRGAFRSAMLWGPPGSGKTSVAGIIEGLYPDAYVTIHAVTAGVQEIRRVTGMADKALQKPIVFIDEIHRFNRVQQDALLPFVENGAIILIGATTENPSFAITSPLLSRTQVIVLKALGASIIEEILQRAMARDEIVASLGKTVSPPCIAAMARAADGDARAALNMLELALDAIEAKHIDLDDLKGLMERPLYHDRTGENHYDLISAFHKCVRAGDVDASIYWLGRMLEAGEDRLFILRRMIRIASEDAGMADPNALRMAVSAKEAFTFVGSPEGEIALYQTAVYLACAPKSNAVYLAEKNAKRLIRDTGTPGVPMALRNAPTRLMKELGYGKGYVYAHDDPEGALTLNYLPEGIDSAELYRPKGAGFEKRIQEILDAREKAKRAGTGSYRKTPRGGG
ncbi:MAG TPA: replication-associated recombination protein A [Deltaproteobacteria bacterium]|nr:replication-associated recombination protein A [Deltaproteobacteria bacterium]